MYCLKCKKVVDDGPEICPHCNAVLWPERCPECWVKLPPGEQICAKCGCDVPKYLSEKEKAASYVEPSLADKIKKLPLGIKIGVPGAVIAVIALAISISVYFGIQGKTRSEKLSEDYLSKVEDSMEIIEKLAHTYEEDVYADDWIVYIENAAKLREEYSLQIETVKNAREAITYANDLISKEGHEEISAAARDVYYAYTACYSYVIGENGKYPNYLKKYQKLQEKYENAIKRLEDITE